MSTQQRVMETMVGLRRMLRALPFAGFGFIVNTMGLYYYRHMTN